MSELCYRLFTRMSQVATRLLPHSVCLHSPHPVAHRGGVAIVANKSFIEDKELQFEDTVPGRAAATTLVGDDGSFAVYVLRQEGEHHDYNSKVGSLAVLSSVTLLT